MTTPAVMAEGGVHIKYFFGGSHEEAPVADFIQNVSESTQEAKIKGMKMKIGIAVSQDGISWGRVEGDDPSGACLVPYSRNDPNQENLNIDEELYVGWPDVVVDPNKQDAFRMYYSTMVRDTKEKCIATAVSSDGFRWTQQGVCLRPDEHGLDAGGCARCAVIRGEDEEILLDTLSFL